MPAALLLPALQAGAGLVQSIFGGGQAGRAQRALQRLKTPVYEPSQSIKDVYGKSLARYNANPYNTSMYNQQMRNVGRNQAGALGAIQDRRGGVSSIAKILQAGNDASLNAASAAEQQQGQNLGQLQSAAGMLTDDKRFEFNINKMLPYEKQMQLLGAKAAGGNQIMNAGLSNIFGGLQSMGQMGMLNKMYGTGSNNRMGSISGMMGVPGVTY